MDFTGRGVDCAGQPVNDRSSPDGANTGALIIRNLLSGIL